MDIVENIYLEKLSKFQSVLKSKAAMCGGATGAFAEVLGQLEQRMSLDADAQAGSATDTESGENLRVSASTGQIDSAVSCASRATGLPEALIKAVIQVESSFRTDAVSGCGAQGLMQLMPGTARSLGVTDSFDAYQNVMGGSTYLAQQLERFGDIRLALAAYNTGPGRIGSLGITDADDQSQYAKISEGVRGYVDKVLAYYKRFSAAQEV